MAAQLIRAVSDDLMPEVIADFAAGEGSLLTAARRIWPKAKILANDISSSTARRLRRVYPDWTVSCSNFLQQHSNSQAKIAAYRGKVDLILLNPPFSERGRAPTVWPLKERVTSGLAAAFTFLALGYLKPDGVLLAILPDGCLSSVRDRKAWDIIRRDYRVDVIANNSVRAFRGATARTSIVRICRLLDGQGCEDPVSTKPKSLSLVRGRAQIHSQFWIETGGIPLVHTTDLRGGRVLSGRLVQEGARFLGPAVLLPRVGYVTKDKIGLLEEGREVVLSDCVIAVACSTYENAVELRAEIIVRWEQFVAQYRGTGAPYLTLERAERFFSLIAFPGNRHASSRSEERELA